MQNNAQIAAARSERKLRDAEATRRKLLDAALLTFSTQGYEGSSTRNIETQAGTKRGLINYHFGSKKALWKAAVEHLMSVTERDLGTALADMNKVVNKPIGGYANPELISTTNQKPDLSKRPEEDHSLSATEIDESRYAEEALKWVENGATIIAGCCRTEPSHIKKLKEIL